jgi:hypothetical protein
MVAGTTLIPAPEKNSEFVAPGYMQAMHGACEKCHKEEDEKNGETRPKLALCGTCHAKPIDLRPLPTRGKEEE